jgi:hypothetical protein
MPKKKMDETAVATVQEEERAVATLDLGQSTGAGREEADQDCYLIPQLKLLQKSSHEVDEDNAAYVKGAKPGMFFLTTTGELFDGEAGVLVVPADFQRRFLEFVPEDQGGGFRGAHMPTDPVVLGAQRDEKGKFWLESGNYLQDARVHYVIFLHPTMPRPAVVTLKSSQIKKSKKWLSQMAEPILLSGDPKKDPESCKYNLEPDCEFRVYRIVSRGEASDQYTWKGVVITEERVVNPADPRDVSAVQAARSFREQIGGGKTRVEFDDEERAQKSDF